MTSEPRAQFRALGGDGRTGLRRGLTTARSPGAGRSTARLTVVVADDSSAIRLLARNALAPRKGFTVVAEASDGAEALRLVEQHRPDCVVLDVEMPGMGGFDALAELQRRSPEIPVVMLSGFSNETVLDRAMTGGAAALLHKDQLTQLGDTVRQAAVGPAQVTAPARPVQPVPGPVSRRSAESPDSALRAAQDDLRRFEYVVSHDFAEPLRALTGFSKLLESSYANVLDDSGKVFLGQITSATARMQGMVDDLLNYSRAGRAEPTLGRVDLNDVVTLVRTSVRDRFPDRGTTVTSAALPDVVGDREMCTTVLRHLVLNGLMFNRAPEPAVRIEGAVVDGSAVISVSDNGFGVAAAQHDTVFELFRRLNTREEFPGTGTGLALCKRIAAVQGGALDLVSSTNDGSVFTLTLPRYADKQGA
jgi:signal transduction histidine kinase